MSNNTSRRLNEKYVFSFNGLLNWENNLMFPMPLNSTGDGLQMIRRWSADDRQQIVDQQYKGRGWAIPSADVGLRTIICIPGHDDGQSSLAIDQNLHDNGESSLAIDQNLHLWIRGWVIPTSDLGLRTIICIPGHDDGQSSLAIDQNLYLRTREWVITRGWVIPTGDLGLWTIICIPGHDDGQSLLAIDQNLYLRTREWMIVTEFVSADKRMGDRHWGLTRICFCGHDDGQSSLVIDQNLYLWTRGWVIPTGDLGLWTIICIPGHDDGQSSLAIDQDLYLRTREWVIVTDDWPEFVSADMTMEFDTRMGDPHWRYITMGDCHWRLPEFVSPDKIDPRWRCGSADHNLHLRTSRWVIATGD
ncbi:hypothetical protein B0H13DRAFT_1894673 [Mycena leptocephala]|nr:hypothetical protein B0H13DRAFT_1894673 [Mycena leptocephala]